MEAPVKWDVVIVGGGAAGCVLARRLAEHRDLSVLVLEAGPDYPDPALLPDEIKFSGTRLAEDPGSRHNWALRGTMTEEQGPVHVAQGKVIGGGSSINGQAMQRGFPQDFDAWAQLGLDEWSYAKVLPYFRKSEHDLDIQDECHGTDGPMPVRRKQAGLDLPFQQAFYDACLGAGFDFVPDKNGRHPVGVGVIPSNNVDGVRMSAAMMYVNPVRHQLNLTIRGDVFVRKVLIENGAAVGVEAESGGEIFRVEAGRVVLSAGAVRSPQLLMLSGIGPADQLREFGIAPLFDLPGVGQNLWNHLSVQVKYKVRDGVSLLGDPARADAIRWLDAARFYLHFPSKQQAPRSDMSMWTTPVADGRKDRVDRLSGDVPAGQAAGVCCGLGLPEGSGYVRLTSADPAVQPEFNYCYLRHPDDRRRLRESVRMAAALLESAAYKDIYEYRIQPGDEVLANDDALDHWMRQTASGSRHLSGTCKMGPDDDPMTVIDQYGRVTGVPGLWVADASVMPRIPGSGGAHATVIMIGERMADWIATGAPAA
jgi:choline dehydrogenase